MKRIPVFLPIFIFAASLVSFKKNTFPIEVFHVDTAVITGSWVLVPVLASDTAAGKIPAINFNSRNKTFTGNTGCNQMSGKYIQHANQISFSHRMVVTKMACEGYNEKQFIESLLRVTSYKFQNGMLILMEGQTPLSKWNRKSNNNTL